MQRFGILLSNALPLHSPPRTKFRSRLLLWKTDWQKQNGKFRLTWLNGIFRINMWNKYGMDHRHRTNNAMESWHSSLNKCLPVHSNIYIFIHGLKICQATAKINLCKAKAGSSPRRRKKYIQLEKIMTAHARYSRGEIDTARLLRTVQHYTNLFKKWHFYMILLLYSFYITFWFIFC